MMATYRASSGEVVDLSPLQSGLRNARTTAIVKSETFETVRLIIRADTDIKAHQVEGAIMLHCLEGRAQLCLPDKTLELSAGKWVYLDGGVSHAIKGIEDSSILLTILFAHGGGDENVQVETSRSAISDQGAKSKNLDALLEEGLKGTFPASDVIAVSDPSRGIGNTGRNGG